MEKRIGDNKFKLYFLKIVLFLFAFGIFGLEKYLVLILSCFLLFTIISEKKTTISIKHQGIPLFLWGLLYSITIIFAGEDIIATCVYFMIAPIVLCGIGYYVVKVSKSETEMLQYVYIIAVGFFLHGAFSILLSMQHGIFEYNAEFIEDIWSGRFVSRTIMGMYMVPIVCISIPALFVSKGRNKGLFKVITIAIILIAVLLSIYVGNRTLLIIVAISILLTIILGLNVSQNKTKFLLITFTIIGISIALYNYDLFGIQEYIRNSFLSSRSEDLITNSRWGVYKEIYSNFSSYLLGNLLNTNTIARLDWAHNIWIDILITGGLIPALLFVWYSVRVLMDTGFVLKDKKLVSFFRVTALIITIGIFLNWAVEPVLQANPYFVSACCMIFSVVSNFSKNKCNRLN